MDYRNFGNIQNRPNFIFILFDDIKDILTRILFDIHRKNQVTQETFEPKNVSAVYLCTMITEQQEKWLKQVAELFMRFGIKALTMDDVARELGISKKTLYQFVESKDELVNKVIEGHLNIECKRAEIISQTATDALEEMITVIRENMMDMQRMKSNIIFELQKYHRSAWDLIQAYQKEFLYKIVMDNLQRGIQEGLYRDDINTDITAKLHLIQTFSIFDEKWFPMPPYTFDEVFKESIISYLYSIMSEKGLKILRKKLQEGAHL